MLTLNEYNDGIDECWYDSSSIVYTKFIENPNDNNGQLYVTFKGGSTYLYKDVDMPIHYLSFKHGMKDNSSGKSLNQYIKPNYEYERVDNITLDEIEQKRLNVIESRNNKPSYFISGHRDGTSEEFDLYYVPAILSILEENQDILFIIGDCEGVDTFAQDYLFDVLEYNPLNIIVCTAKEHTSYVNPKAVNVENFETHQERDEAMTHKSQYDIAFVRKGKENSGTAKNLIRRHLMS